MPAREAAAGPKPSQRPPSAEIVGLQFGLATAKEFLRFSVIESRCKDSLKNLVDPRLGLPAENEICATCGGTNYEECAGHFAHVKLTQPIFHPNHLRLLQRILQKICLACGVPKVKKKKTTFTEEAGNREQSSGDFNPEQVNGDREHPVILGAEPIEKVADDDVIDLSSSDEIDCIDIQSGIDIPSGLLRVMVPPGPLDFTIGSTSQSVIMNLPQLGSYKTKGKAHANGSSHLEVTTSSIKKSEIDSKRSARMKSQFTQSPLKGPVKSTVKIYKGRPAGLDVLNADTFQTAKSSKSLICLHCSPGYPDYRPILVKVLPVKGRKMDDSSEILLLEVQVSRNEEDVWLPDDFWAFLKGPAHPKDSESKVPKTHVLSPSEALTILKKIPERAIGKLGMNRLVARPEGLIMKCVPIPPNCTRTADYKYVNNTTAVRFGSDDVTRTLQNLVTEIGRIHRTRAGKAMSRAQRDESTTLQILTAEYLREKGAPKAMPGKEPLKKDRNGRITKQDDHRWTKEWLSQNVLAKGGNYTARAVIAGDPSLGIEEIGVPWAIAQKLTLPERATRWNCTKLQEYVDRSQTLQAVSGKPSATRIERSGQAFQVLPDGTHKVQIGDVIHRSIQNGDYVYVNRPPSVHKHSLMALQVHVHYGLVITINPLVCPPFSADFDGDIFHIFIPQSLRAVAELEQLMAVPQQMVSDRGGQPLLGLTQDTLLAAHLLTTSKLFVDKASMDQLCLWSSKQRPEAAILKSPKGGPFWTGEQVFGLTLPAKLNMGSPEESILIQGGQITKWIDGAKLLRKDKESIASALCLQLGPLALVDYLNNATGLLHAWLQVQGFSTILTDFQVTDDSVARHKMLRSIFEECYLKSVQESCDSVRILDAKVQAMGPDLNPDSLTKNVKFLEQAAQHIFRTRERDAENIVMKYAEANNSLLLMVNSGSKGSRGKLLQQIAGMGLQLYKGKHLLPFPGLRRPSMSDDPVLDWWKDRGLVQSSLVDGLNAPELFNHVIADRTGILRKHVEVAQPGTLFKSLMLFLRDLHVQYDGSVRSQCGKNLVQFCYGGAEGVPRRTVSKKGSIQNQFGMDDPSTPMEEAEGDLACEEDDRKRWLLSHLAGEPVGVLAATAISQPAYEVMLDAPNLNGPFNPRPLELVQETLYPREKTDLKPIDRCVIIRLENCVCTKPLCLERRVLEVQTYLTRITLKTLAQSSAIEFWNMEDFRLAGPSGEALRLGSPWLGHIKLSLDMMQQHKVNVEDIVQRLCNKFSAIIKKPKKHPLGQIFFCYSCNCSISNGCCLHFSPRLPKKIQNEQDDDIYNAALSNLLMKIRATIIPGLLDCTVKGDERLESVRIVSERPTRTTWHNKLAYNRNLDEELVLEIFVSPTTSKSGRSMAWASVKQACLPLMDMVDWNRSMPYSIQEMRHALGIEAAYQMVTKRLRLVLEKTAPHTHHEHEKLIADMMTFSGDANGFTFSGFQDMNKSTAVSAPFAEASFQKPIRTLLDAAGRGATDSVEGVMTNCVWGKEAPLGTGSSFDLFWQPSKDLRRVATSREAKRDVHAIWKDLDEKCIPDKVVPLSPTHSLPGLHILPEGDPDLDDGAGFSPQHAPYGSNADDILGSSHQNNNGDGGTWGNSPVARENDGGWGDIDKASHGNNHGGWDQDDSSDGIKGQGEPEEQGGRRSVSKEKGMSGNTWDDKSKEHITQGGWEDGAAETGNEGGWGDEGDGYDLGRSQPNEVERSDGVKSKQINIQSERNSSKDLGGWEPSNQSGGWDDRETVPDQGSWDNVPVDIAGLEFSGNLKTSNKVPISTAESTGTASGGGNSSAWSAGPSVQEIGGGDWGSVSTEVAEGDGWDSLAGSRTDSARLSGSEHTDHRHGSCAEDNRSQERHLAAYEENREGERTWNSRGGGRGRGCGHYGKDWSSTRSTSAPGANVIPPGERRQFDNYWNDVPTSTKTPTRSDGNWSKLDTGCSDSVLQSSDQDQATGTKTVDARATNNWASSPIAQSNVPAADGWGTVLPENSVAGNQARTAHPSVGVMSRILRHQETEPECKEIDDLVKSMRRILFNHKNEIGGRLSDKDDEAVQAVLAYHPNFKEKAGCGVAYIKVGKSQDYSVSNCFWLVRTDGSEIEFSYHKCLIEKVSREFPSFAPDWYDNLYKSRRSLIPPATLVEQGRPADQREDIVTQGEQESAPLIVVDITPESICEGLTESINRQP